MKSTPTLLIGLFCLVNIALATPDLFVQFDRISLESDRLNVEVIKSKLDKLESISIDTKKANFSVPSRLLKKIWGPNLQEIQLSQSINLTKVVKPQSYQMYIEFDHFSSEGCGPTEDEKLEGYEMVIYFDENQLRSISVSKDGKHVEDIYTIP